MKCVECGRLPMQRPSRHMSFRQTHTRYEAAREPSAVCQVLITISKQTGYLKRLAHSLCKLHAHSLCRIQRPSTVPHMPSAVDYRIAAPPVKYDDSGTSEEVRTHLTKIGRWPLSAMHTGSLPDNARALQESRHKSVAFQPAFKGLKRKIKDGPSLLSPILSMQFII